MPGIMKILTLFLIQFFIIHPVLSQTHHQRNLLSSAYDKEKLLEI